MKRFWIGVCFLAVICVSLQAEVMERKACIITSHKGSALTPDGKVDAGEWVDGNLLGKFAAADGGEQPQTILYGSYSGREIQLGMACDNAPDNGDTVELCFWQKDQKGNEYFSRISIDRKKGVTVVEDKADAIDVKGSINSAAGRWTCEIAVNLKKQSVVNGAMLLFQASRDLGGKLYTYSPVKWGGIANRMFSSLLVFGSMDVVRNGDFRNGTEGWDVSEASLAKKVEKGMEISAADDKEIKLRQAISVFAFEDYELGIKGDLSNWEGTVAVYVGDGLEAFFAKKGIISKTEFITFQPSSPDWTYDNIPAPHGIIRNDIEIIAAGKGKLTLENVALRIKPQLQILHSSTVCLTSNSEINDRNVQIAGRYTYRVPFSDIEQFPFVKERQGAPRPLGKADCGGSTGWIDFGKGALTLKGESIAFIPYIPMEWRDGKPRMYSVLFDLGKDYYVEEVRIRVAEDFDISSMSLWGRSDGKKKFQLLKRCGGWGYDVEKYFDSSGRHWCFKNIGSSCRYLWLNIDTCLRALWNSGMVYNIEIWGREAGGEKGISPYVHKRGKVFNDFPRIVQPGTEEVIIVPKPQEMKTKEGVFSFDKNARIYADKSNEASLAGANIFAEELKSEYLLDLQIFDIEQAKKDGLKKAIVFLPLSSEANKLPVKSAVEPVKKPEGYSLEVTGDHALIRGSDRQGMIYGALSLLQTIRHTQKDYEYTFPCMEVRDWSYLERRMITTATHDCMYIGGQWKALVRPMAYLKLNTLFLTCRPGMGPELYNNVERRWENARELSELAYKYGIRVLPDFENRAIVLDNFTLKTIEQDIKRYAESFPYADYMVLSIPTSYYTSDIFKANYKDAIDFMKQFYGLCKSINKLPLFTVTYGNSAKLYHGAGLNITPYMDRLGELPKDFGFNCVLMTKYGDEKLLDVLEQSGYSNAFLYFGTDILFADVLPDVPTQKFKGIGILCDGGTMYRIWVKEFFPNGRTALRNISIFSNMTWSPEKNILGTRAFFDQAIEIGRQMFGKCYSYTPPSLRTGRPQEDYQIIDITSVCNDAYVDRAAGDGKGWMDFGANFDYRNIPSGKTVFDHVPFYVIPGNREQNMILIRNSVAEMMPVNGKTSVAIPIGGKYSSLLFLRTAFSHGASMGFPPFYRMVYKDGSFVSRVLDCKKSGHSTEWNRILKGSPFNNLYDFTRKNISIKLRDKTTLEVFAPGFASCGLAHLAWLGYTGSGDERELYFNEFVNPYPEKEIEKVEAGFYPEHLKRGVSEAIFAVTGIKAGDFDVQYWQKRERPALNNLKELNPGNIKGRPIFQNGTFAKGADKVLEFKKGDKLIALLRGLDMQILGSRRYAPVAKLFDPLNINYQEKKSMVECEFMSMEFAEEKEVTGIAIRGRLNHPRDEGGEIIYAEKAPVDYKVLISPDGKEWKLVAQNKNICGEDGIFYHGIEEKGVKYLKIMLGAAEYGIYYVQLNQNAPGLSYVQVYEAP